jgi:hypothetical protein
MFYKAIGLAAWTGAKWYLRRRVSNAAMLGAALAVAGAAGSAYLASRSDSEHHVAH